MSFPERLLDSDLTPVERALLEFGVKDAPDAASRRRILQGVLLSAATAGSASALGVAAATPTVKSSVGAIALWLSVGAVGGAVTATAVEVLRTRSVPAHEERALPAVTSGTASERPKPSTLTRPQNAELAQPSAPSLRPSAGAPIGTERTPVVQDRRPPQLDAPSPTYPPPAVTSERAAPNKVAIAGASGSSGEALRAEIARLDEARQKNAQGAHAEALALLAAEGPGRPTLLAPEADLVRLDALAALGRIPEGRALAARFLATRPSSPLSPRVKAWLVSHGGP